MNSFGGLSEMVGDNSGNASLVVNRSLNSLEVVFPSMVGGPNSHTRLDFEVSIINGPRSPSIQEVREL